MPKLYWKIFLSFWLATIFIIITTAWITSQITQKSSIHAHERMFMDSYANAAVSTYELGGEAALKKWLMQTGQQQHMTFYLLTSSGLVISNASAPEEIKSISRNLTNDELDVGIFKFGDFVISHEIFSTSGKIYRLAAFTQKPISHLVELPWGGLSIRLILATFISGLICYLLSIYLTKPLTSLTSAAKSIGKGELNTRVIIRGHKKDEIAKLSEEFNRMAAQLESLIQSKQRLLQNISHELRSPLARVQVAVEIGRKKAKDLANTEFSRIELECVRLNELLEEILQFTRLDESFISLNHIKVNLKNLLQAVIDDANFEFAQENKKVLLKRAEDIEASVDIKLFQRAVENIIRNALRYSPPEQEVCVELYKHSSKDIIINVSDRGPGVPNNQLDKILTPFYRVDTAREKKTGGYGLGLAIANQAIKLHGGTIVIKNRPGGGLLVRITLPGTTA